MLLSAPALAAPSSSKPCRKGLPLLIDLELAGRLSGADWLERAIAIVTAVSQIHAARIIHKDLNPQNIVRNPETVQVKVKLS